MNIDRLNYDLPSGSEELFLISSTMLVLKLILESAKKGGLCWKSVRSYTRDPQKSLERVLVGKELSSIGTSIFSSVKCL